VTPVVLLLPGGSTVWPSASADRALLERVLAETGVERAPARPATVEYLQVWSEAVRLWLERFLGRHPGLWENVTWGLTVTAWLLVGAAVALLVFAIVRLARRRRRAQEKTVVAIAPSVLSPRPDREEWRRELERRLAAGDLDGALEALWWWFAASLVREIDPSWTSQQLLLEARRPDLGFAAVELDRALYGPRRPRADDVSALVTRLEASLA
jgi:hypothetical protein